MIKKGGIATMIFGGTRKHGSDKPRLNGISLRWFVVPAAIWLIAAILSIGHPDGLRFEQYLFLTQDAPVATLLLVCLALLPWPRVRAKPGSSFPPWILASAILFLVLLAWAGHYWLMSGYTLSRDETLARMTASTLAQQGKLGLAIPPEWRAYHDALSPAFLNPMGSDRFWISIYLPGSAAIEALVSQIADPALTQPLLLALGLLALWDGARLLLPNRPDARAVVMLLALTSSQLLFNAMTAYAMTAHFALNMVWLALFLRDRPGCHVAALLVGALALALHKVQFHILFAGPVLAILLWQRRWKLSAIYAGCYTLFLLFWMKIYPIILIDALDLAVPAKAATGVSLSPRLQSLEPLLYIPRLFAWNNALLLPLAMLGAGLAISLWRRGSGQDDTEQHRTMLFLGLAVGCGLGLLLTVHQGLGWGYRYLHGYIGSFCLLAGLGWTRLHHSPAGLRPVILTSILATALMIVQAGMIYRMTTPYARLHAEALARQADVVLVDTRGSAFSQDIIRLEGAPLRPPMLMDLAKLNERQLTDLCREYRVQIIDRDEYRRAGILADDSRPEAARVAALRAYLNQINCGREDPPSGLVAGASL